MYNIRLWRNVVVMFNGVISSSKNCQDAFELLYNYVYFCGWLCVCVCVLIRMYIKIRLELTSRKKTNVKNNQIIVFYDLLVSIIY